MKAIFLPSRIPNILLFLESLLVIALFLPTFKMLYAQWGMKEDYSYGYLIPLVVAYLLYEKRHEFLRIPSMRSWTGAFIFLIGIFFFWLGELGGEYLTLYLSFWLIVLGLCWMQFGWRKLKTILFPLFFMLTMFPLPNFLYQKVTVWLKLISSQLGVDLIQWYGMSAYREGNIIDLGFTQLQVVDACSGLRYLIPLLVLGILLAYFYRAHLWKKAFLILSTIPLSVCTNSLRISLTGILYESWGPKVAEGFFHGFSGWFIFMFSMGVLLGEMWLLNKIIPEKRDESKYDKHVSSQNPASPEKISSLEGNRAAVSIPFQGLLAVLFLGGSLAASYGVEFREQIPINQPLSRFPLQLGEWKGERGSIEVKFLNALHLSDYATIDYRNAANKSVNFYVAYYESQRKGESIHTPATCLPSSGWVFQQAGEARVPIGGSTHVMPVNRAVMQKGDTKQLSYFWFPQRGRTLTNAYELKLYAFWDALTKQRTDGALVRIITPVYPLEEVAQAEKRLQVFMKEAVPALREYIPGETVKPVSTSSGAN